MDSSRLDHSLEKKRESGRHGVVPRFPSVGQLSWPCAISSGYANASRPYDESLTYRPFRPVSRRRMGITLEGKLIDGGLKDSPCAPSIFVEDGVWQQAHRRHRMPGNIVPYCTVQPVFHKSFDARNCWRSFTNTLPSLPYAATTQNEPTLSVPSLRTVETAAVALPLK